MHKNLYVFEETDMRGMAIRLAMLQTHYRKPKDFTVAELNQCAKTLRRWLSIAELSIDISTPDEVINALNDDLNTHQAITEIHKYAANKDGKKVFSAMKFLGLIPGTGSSIDYGMLGEIKTIPIDRIPLVQWEEKKKLNA